MKRNLWILLIVLISTFLLSSTSIAWQGRMAGMGNPYGLVQDESDMLIHPAMIMNSSGTRFYTHYRFTYTDVLDWDYKWDLEFAGMEIKDDFKASGDEFNHEALVGSAFNFGPGRMGIFFTYENMNGDYDGKSNPNLFNPDETNFDLNSDKNDFALRFLYGFPKDCIDFGFEAGFGYHNEENTASMEFLGFDTKNPLFDLLLLPLFLESNIYTYMIPYDSEYYDIFAKASIASELGCSADFGLTLHGSYIFSGDNELHSSSDLFSYNAKLEGDVEGISVGGDFWVRYKVDDAFSLPFLVSAGYQRKVRDGNDNALIGTTPVDFYYEHTEVNWNIEAGGGVDIALDNTSKIASGIYYRYLENNNELLVDLDFAAGSINNNMDIPDYDEHRITLKFAYEKNISPTVDLRGGFDCFYGWGDWIYRNKLSSPPIKESASLDGDLWGFGLTLGGTIKVDPVTLEPFIGAAYQQTDLDGHGKITGLAGADIEKGDYKRNQWLLTTGLSILF